MIKSDPAQFCAARHVLRVASSAWTFVWALAPGELSEPSATVRGGLGTPSPGIRPSSTKLNVVYTNTHQRTSPPAMATRLQHHETPGRRFRLICVYPGKSKVLTGASNVTTPQARTIEPVSSIASSPRSLAFGVAGSKARKKRNGHGRPDEPCSLGRQRRVASANAPVWRVGVSSVFKRVGWRSRRANIRDNASPSVYYTAQRRVWRSARPPLAPPRAGRDDARPTPGRPTV